MGKAPSTKKLRFWYIIYLLQKFHALSCKELAKFNEVTERMMRGHLNEMMALDLIAYQSKRYFLRPKGKEITFLHDL